MAAATSVPWRQIQALPPGRTEVDGDTLFAMASVGPGKTVAEARLELRDTSGINGQVALSYAKGDVIDPQAGTRLRDLAPGGRPPQRPATGPPPASGSLSPR